MWRSAYILNDFRISNLRQTIYAITLDAFSASEGLNADGLLIWVRSLSVDISLKILGKSLGGTVLVKLRNGKLIRGLLQGYDQHMNLVLDGAEEIQNNGAALKLGVIIVRGDNIVMVSPAVLKKEEQTG
jgi:small nuclear ribonucleoprotein